MLPPSEERTPLSISQLNQMIKELLESTLPPLWVEGEISNFAKPGSGHMYFSLKDNNSQVRAVMFRNRNMLLNFKPQNGSQVMAKVRIGFYEARGEFQLLVDRLEEAGDGQLQQQFDQLKRKLASEGLFDEHHKQELPELPKRIGVITSPTGAAIRDVISVLQRRFPAIPVSIYPVPVQGDGSAAKIAAAIELADNQAECDVLLLVRGGGSLEDLWSFNEEVVARAIFACETPIVSGVGHETDVTIADFAADVRAATPSAAAELVVPDQYSYLQSYDYYSERLQQLMQRKLQQAQQQLGWLQHRLQQQHPQTKLAQFKQRQTTLYRRLLQSWKRDSQSQQRRLDQLINRLQQQHPSLKLAHYQQQLQAATRRLKQQSKQQLIQNKQRLAISARTLHAFSPLLTLARGYSIVRLASSGQTITANDQLKVDDLLDIRLDQGSVNAIVTKTSSKSKT